ncbi:hypothetical protein J6S88_01050 [bacterium]|nr:hypothetical protein [bacterium]
MKERMITRTIVNSAVSVKVYDETTDEITSTVLDIQGKFSDDELKKRCENRLSGSSFKVLKIMNVETTEKLYAMPESTFMLYAVEVPARNSKEEEEEG